MKNGSLLLIALNLFNMCIISMELSPRSAQLFQQPTPELKQILFLLQKIESEASYANPHAVARIEAASKELFTLEQPALLLIAWSKSQARSNATIHYERSCTVLNQHKNSIFESSAQLLHQHATQIFLAITELNEKIEKTITAEKASF